MVRQRGALYLLAVVPISLNNSRREIFNLDGRRIYSADEAGRMGGRELPRPRYRLQSEIRNDGLQSWQAMQNERMQLRYAQRYVTRIRIERLQQSRRRDEGTHGLLQEMGRTRDGRPPVDRLMLCRSVFGRALPCLLVPIIPTRRVVAGRKSWRVIMKKRKSKKLTVRLADYQTARDEWIGGAMEHCRNDLKIADPSALSCYRAGMGLGWALCSTFYREQGVEHDFASHLQRKVLP